MRTFNDDGLILAQSKERFYKSPQEKNKFGLFASQLDISFFQAFNALFPYIMFSLAGFCALPKMTDCLE